MLYIEQWRVEIRKLNCEYMKNNMSECEYIEKRNAIFAKHTKQELSKAQDGPQNPAPSRVYSPKGEP